MADLGENYFKGATGAAPGRRIAALAPMAEFTDAPMRLMASRHGASYCATEMVNALACGMGQPASWRLLELLPGEGPVAAHLYGANPDDFARAAERICATGGFASIDINCGCPVERVARCGAGAELLKTPELIGRIVKATVEHSNIPVSLKTRIGLREGEDAAPLVARIAADAGAKWIAIHGRYRTQFHSGAVHFDKIAEVVNLGLIPVIANGGIWNCATAEEMFDRTGCSGVMVGWNAVGNPWVFKEIHGQMPDPLRDTSPHAPVGEVRAAFLEHLSLSLRFHRLLDEKYPEAALRITPEEATVLSFRTQLFRYLGGMHGASKLRGRMFELKTLQDVVSGAESVFEAEERFCASQGGGAANG